MQDETLDILGRYHARMLGMPARRAELIAEAREAGHTWQEIGEALGMSHAGAMKAAKVTRD